MKASLRFEPKHNPFDTMLAHKSSRMITLIHSYLLVTSVRHEVEESHVLVATRLRVRDPGQRVQLEAVCVAPLAPVHVVAKGEDQLEDLLEPLAALHLLRRLQHGLDLGTELVQPDCELLLVVKSPQALLVVSHSEGISRSSMDDKAVTIITNSITITIIFIIIIVLVDLIS